MRRSLPAMIMAWHCTALTAGSSSSFIANVTSGSLAFGSESPFRPRPAATFGRRREPIAIAAARASSTLDWSPLSSSPIAARAGSGAKFIPSFCLYPHLSLLCSHVSDSIPSASMTIAIQSDLIHWIIILWFIPSASCFVTPKSSLRRRRQNHSPFPRSVGLRP